MVSGKLGQQVLPGLLPPAWLQCPSRSESPRAAGEEGLPLPAASWQAGGAEENKQVGILEVSKTPQIRADQLHRRFHCLPPTCTEMPSPPISVLTKKFSSPHLNYKHGQSLLLLVFACAHHCCLLRSRTRPPACAPELRAASADGREKCRSGDLCLKNCCPQSLPDI